MRHSLDQAGRIARDLEDSSATQAYRDHLATASGHPSPGPGILEMRVETVVLFLTEAESIRIVVCLRAGGQVARLLDLEPVLQPVGIGIDRLFEVARNQGYACPDVVLGRSGRGDVPSGPDGLLVSFPEEKAHVACR